MLSRNGCINILKANIKLIFSNLPFDLMNLLTIPVMFQTFKQEAADETDGELQIDESAGQSPVEPPECDGNSIGGWWAAWTRLPVMGISVTCLSRQCTISKTILLLPYYVKWKCWSCLICMMDCCNECFFISITGMVLLSLLLHHRPKFQNPCVFCLLKVLASVYYRKNKLQSFSVPLL